MSVNPCVWDCHSTKKCPANAVYVGCLVMKPFSNKVIRKGTPFGNAKNPFVHPKHPDSHANSPIAGNEADFRAHAVKRMAADPVFRQQVEALKGKDLLCYCVQSGSEREKFCHARVWLDLANPRYFENFLTPQEAADLWKLVKSLPRFRKGNEYMGQQIGYLKRLSMPTWSLTAVFRGRAISEKEVGEYSSLKLMIHKMEEAPREVRDLAIKLSLFAGKPVNYFSLVGYANENDHIEPHQHGEDRTKDARVFIISLGAMRRFYLSPVCAKCRICAKCNESDCKDLARTKGHVRDCAACKKAKEYRTTHCQSDARVKQGEMFEPKSGSMIALSSQENFTHYHAVLDSKTTKRLRISFNTKCLDTEESLASYIKRMKGKPSPETSNKADREMAADYLRSLLSG